ncbi:MAG: ABC transporter substrate-binding protein [Candidatus Tectomicrobia bacterium]|uniref:ABC transporter substrate-binding protein n=1 Tax=Tectimicrobiota bacterium TaxID=2528274 RepID=A0A933LQZ1_UNCTE|nr:ABC transporter substrate-binding protein [Candidatus Tectomicrobia bacterium]
MTKLVAFLTGLVCLPFFVLATPSGAVKPAPKGKVTAVVATLGQQLVDPSHGKNGMMRPVSYHLQADLVRRDLEGKWVPALASSWEISPDGLSWKFTLRKGAKFHNGEEVTAQDVLYAYERCFLPEMANPNLKTFQSTVEKLEVKDDYTIVYHTKGPQPMLLNNIPVVAAPRKYLEKVGTDGYAKNPVGAGPFKLVKNAIGEYMEWEAFENYYSPEEVPHVKTAVMRVVPEAATRIAMLKTGEADIVHGVAGAQIKEIESTAGLRTLSGPSSGSSHLQFLNMYNSSSPFSDMRVRQALAHAIDRQAIVNKIYFGQALPTAVGGISKAQFGWNPDLKPYAYDPQKSKKLLAEAGYPNGFTAKIVTYDTATVPKTPDQMEALAAFFTQVGVKTTVTLMETGTYTARFRDKSLAKDYDMGPITMPTAPAYDVGYTTSIFYISTAPYTYINNPKIDELWKQSQHIVNPKEREQVLGKIQEIAYEEVLGLGTIESHSIFGIGPRVKEWKLQVGNPYLLGLERVALNPEKQ